MRRAKKTKEIEVNGRVVIATPKQRLYVKDILAGHSVRDVAARRKVDFSTVYVQLYRLMKSNDMPCNGVASWEANFGVPYSKGKPKGRPAGKPNVKKIAGKCEKTRAVERWVDENVPN